MRLEETAQLGFSLIALGTRYDMRHKVDGIHPVGNGGAGTRLSSEMEKLGFTDGAHDGVGNQLKDGARGRVSHEDEEQMGRMTRKEREIVKKIEEIKLEKKDRPEDLEEDGMEAIKELPSDRCV